MQDWLQQNPHIRSVRVGAADLNGQARGKRMPVAAAEKLLVAGTRFPMSVLSLDILGEDIKDSPLVFETGDRDAVLRPTERGFVPLPWLETPSALLPVSMAHEDGRPYGGDPRQALAAVLARYAARGLRPVVGVELEFFLIDDSGPVPQMPRSPLSGKRQMSGDILSLAVMDAFDGYFTALYEGCEAIGIPAEASISESGMGQFEMILAHGDDALRMADDAWLFKMLAKGLARRHGMAASFMAKPYPESSGNGMHVHFSVLRADGSNAFDDGSDAGSGMLRHAVAGCLAAMPGSTLIFAPHANSYARMVPGSHAPTGVAWAYENRTVAIRIPAGSPKARRIEHRVAGGDVNPYLLLAAILGAALNGIEDAGIPPAPITGNAYDARLPQIPGDWQSALAAFGTSPEIARIFAPELISNMQHTKRQEQRHMAALDDAAQLALYLERV